jgi:hypothetical protein
VLPVTRTQRTLRLELLEGLLASERTAHHTQQGNEAHAAQRIANIDHCGGIRLARTP